MRRFFLVLFVFLFLPLFFVNAALAPSKLKGKILLQVESRGEAYYVHPVTSDAYYMANGDEFSREHFKEEYPYGTRFVTKEEVEAGTYPQLKEGVYKEYANREPRFYASVSYNGCVWALLKNAETTDYKNDVEKML